MKIIIIEDEERAAKRLQKMLEEIDANIEIVATAVSIESSIKILDQSIDYDIIFMDIHLADGASFEIFNYVSITKPLIFVTAYDEYAAKAFTVNALDYILKPVKKAELERAYEKVSRTHFSTGFNYRKLAKAVKESEYEKRFLIRIGQQIKVVEIKEAAYFYTKDKVTFVVTKAGKRYPMDLSLEKLEDLLDGRTFFRINRQLIVGIESIQEMYVYSKSRVKLKLTPSCELETIVSTARSPHFKKWLVGE